MALYQVHVVESSFVVPKKETPGEGLWLSPLDLERATRGHTPLVYFYHSPGVTASDFFDVAALKEAMAQALVPFYPLAGRLDVDDRGRMEISCTGEGALFVVAHSDHTMDDFVTLKPSPTLRRLLVPEPEPSIITAVQVTFLKCGAVALGTAIHHAAVDAMSTFHFIGTWSAFCRDGNGAVVEFPCHDRTLVRARSPPVVHPDALSLLSLPSAGTARHRPPTASRDFTISEDQVAALKRLCGGASTFSAISALLWQCTCVARRLPPDAEARVSFPVNLRRRACPPLPDRYFGNAVANVFATGAARDIASEPLEFVARRIAATIAQVNGELVQSAIDHYELAEAERRPVSGTLHPETDVRVVSWLGMPIHDADFGWGKPSVTQRAEYLYCGFVYLMDEGPADSGAVRAVICMEAANLDDFERLMRHSCMHARL